MHDDTTDETHNDPHVKFSNVIECFEDGDSERALHLIDEHIRQDPHDDEAYGIKIQILVNMKRWGDIIECVDHITNIPKFKAMILKARMYGRMNKLEKARAYLDMAEKVEGGKTARMCEAKADILGIMSAIGNPEVIDEAIMYAEKACSLEEKNGVYHTTAAAVLFSKFASTGHVKNNMDILKRSFEHGKKALKYGKYKAPVYYNMGRVLFAVEKFNKSLKYFKLAYKEDPNYIRARGMVGVVIAYQDGKTRKQYQSAIKHMVYVLQNDPSCTFLYNGIGQAYLKIDDVTNATSYLEMAARVDPNNVWIWTALTTAYITSGNMKDANRCHKIAASLNPEIPGISEALKKYKELSNKHAKTQQSKPHKSETVEPQHKDTQYEWSVNLKKI